MIIKKGIPYKESIIETKGIQHSGQIKEAGARQWSEREWLAGEIQQGFPDYSDQIDVLNLPKWRDFELWVEFEFLSWEISEVSFELRI